MQASLQLRILFRLRAEFRDFCWVREAPLAGLPLPAVEGLAFAFGRSGGNLILAGEVLLLSYHAGPSRAIYTATGLFTACVLGRAFWVLFHTSKHSDLESLPDIWSWEPQVIHRCNGSKQERHGVSAIRHFSFQYIQPSTACFRDLTPPTKIYTLVTLRSFCL